MKEEKKKGKKDVRRTRRKDERLYKEGRQGLLGDKKKQNGLLLDQIWMMADVLSSANWSQSHGQRINLVKELSNLSANTENFVNCFGCKTTSPQLSLSLVLILSQSSFHKWRKQRNNKQINVINGCKKEFIARENNRKLAC